MSNEELLRRLAGKFDEPAQTLRESNRRDAYRPDIDGLRAISVLAVILFHIDASFVPGGFVGVDIFFVISGYLITLGILRGIDAGNFSLLDFYRRRVKRIGPALLVVIAFVLFASQLLLRPDDAEDAARSAFWALLSMANVHFWSSADTSYFADSSAEMPLLHLWSLGVEEQFYLLWPLTLMLFGNRLHSRWTAIVIVLLSVSSFILAELLARMNPDFSYYMLPTRAGELLLGALVAFHQLKREKDGRAQGPTSGGLGRRFLWSPSTGMVGLILVLLSLLMIDENDVFPGLRAIPPTLGAALLILSGAGSENIVFRLLSLRPLRLIGLVSYSAYLWHWPLLAFYRYGNDSIGPGAGLVLIAVTFALAWLSYLYVEQPARRSLASPWSVISTQYVVPASALAVAAFISVKSRGMAIHELIGDYPTKLAQVQALTKPAYQYSYVCQRQELAPEDLINAECVHGSQGTQAFLWGDSHAAHYVGIVGSIAEAGGFRVRNAAIGACPPLFADPTPFVHARRLQQCRASLNLVRNALMDVPVIIIGADWTGYATASSTFIEQVSGTVQQLVAQGKRVILLGQVPFIAGFDRLCEEKELSYPGMECEPFSVSSSEATRQINLVLREIADKSDAVEYFDVDQYLCSGTTCSAFDEAGEPRYYDSWHLSLDGSWRIGRNIVAAVGVPASFKAALKSGKSTLGSHE